jgi:hypothetical protein
VLLELTDADMSFNADEVFVFKRACKDVSKAESSVVHRLVTGKDERSTVHPTDVLSIVLFKAPLLSVWKRVMVTYPNIKQLETEGEIGIVTPALHAS